MKILDATTGFKGIWYIKNHPFVTFIDKRKGWMDGKTENISFKNRRRWKIDPNIVCEWKDIPFENAYFDMVIFDPPHLIIDRGKSIPQMAKAYGYLYSDNWKNELREGIKKLFDVLKPEGVFVLKWCENNVKVQEIFKLCPYPPLFGSNTKSKGRTKNFWILFIKYKLEKELDIN